MKKILHIINGLERGGAEKMLLKFVNYSVSNKNINNIVLSLTKSGSLLNDFKKPNSEIYEIGLNSINLISNIKTLNEIKKKHKINVVQGWMYHGNLFAFIFQKIFFSKAKLFFNVRHALYNFKFENYKNIFSITLGKFISRFADKIIYNSAVSKNHHEDKGYSNKNGVIVRNGFIELKHFEEKKKLSPWLIDNDTFVIGKIARFHKIKAYDIFLQACSLVDKKCKILVVCIGRGTDGLEFKKLISKYKFNIKPITVGEVFNPEIYLKDIDILINSSFTESMPNIIGEAFLHDTFCIATNVGDTHLYFDDKEFLFEPGDFRSLEKKIENFIKLNKDQKSKLIDTSKNNLFSNYSIKKVCSKYFELYNLQ